MYKENTKQSIENIEKLLATKFYKTTNFYIGNCRRRHFNTSEEKKVPGLSQIGALIGGTNFYSETLWFLRLGKENTKLHFFPLAAFVFFRIHFSFTFPCSYFYFRARKHVSAKKRQRSPLQCSTYIVYPLSCTDRNSVQLSAVGCYSIARQIINVSELVGRVRNVVLIKCIFGSGKPGGSGFWVGRWGTGEVSLRATWERGGRMDGSCHSKEGSK
jgi:hypothetical protein